ncbi:MAG: dipeptide epimerase [Kordiimonadaceae bacterium]|nr:dipeptide epimerase [Kordiimonadaceae bacterium]MBO6567587.1 dipeptide epimerase [Kordiimonadaceae bacterium]MBO6963199.1 dipeptide epimerase [Kordiimonadaceae bacterium]
MIDYRLSIETWDLKVPFVISRRQCDSAEVLTIKLEHAGAVGRGEAAGINYKGETPATMRAELEAFMMQHKEPLTRDLLMDILPAGGARNALDCAFWDLMAKRTGKSIFDLTASLAKPVTSAITLSIDAPARMASKAIETPSSVLKLKLADKSALECVAAVHQARPDAEIIVDANEALNFDLLRDLAPKLNDMNVKLIEQPLPRGEDDCLSEYKSPVPLCADESCMTASDVPHLRTLYDVINIKLDKCGGLTAALDLATAAELHSMDMMVGCMLGTSLAMAPAMVIAPRCKYIDLDGPMLLKNDRENGLAVKDGTIEPPSPLLWG